MKILQIVSYFNPKFGGDVLACYNLTRQLAKKGHSVTILTTDFGFDTGFAENLMSEGVQIIPFPVLAHVGLFIYTPSIKAWLRENGKDFEIIHLHNFRSYQNNCAVSYAVKNTIPFILQAHGSVQPFFQKQLLKKLYDRVWGNNLLKNTSGIIALCESEADQYRKMNIPEDKIRIIPNSIDLSEFSDLPLKGTFRTKYGIGENEKVILFLGRIHKIKGIDILIEAYADLVKEVPEIRLVIAGPDDHFLSVLQDQIRRLHVEKQPLFTGPLYNQEKLAAYVDADVYVLPSRYETYPTTVLEAWACGTPVIITTGCLSSDLVEKAGYVSSPDAAGLKDTILTVFSYKDQREGNITRGLELVKTELNMASYIRKMEDFYKEIILSPFQP
jgi:glycosyltransferase involved in cell wall biosynthesis